MYRPYNANPARRTTNDCVIRAISKIMGISWEKAHDYLAKEARQKYDTMDANHVWIGWLKRHGFNLYSIPSTCPDCYTVRDFCKDHPVGKYILGTGTHTIAIIDGNYYDSFDSGDMVPTFYLRRRLLNGI